MMIELTLPLIESVINQALKSDSRAQKKLACIEKKVIKVNCIDWQITFYILCYANRLQFEKKFDQMADTEITGKLSNFLQIFARGADTKTLFHFPIDISGNTHTVEVLRDIFRNLDLDLEEKLSYVVGDVLAHKIFSQAKKTKKVIQHKANNLVSQSGDYLHFEIKALPTRKQVEKFYGGVMEIRDGADRLEARITQLRDQM